VKSLMSLWSCMANELAIRCCTSATRDIKYVAGRAEHEGLWFLAVTLADFGKAIQKWLDQGFVVPSDAPSFKKASGRRTGLPAFLSGFLGRVFDPSSGVLLDEPDIETIYALRQLTLVFSKIAFSEVPRKGGPRQDGDPSSKTKVVSPEREKLAMSEYIQCENDVKRSDSLLDESFLEDFRNMSEMLFGSLFAKVDRDIYWGRLMPKHGPGATADRLRGNAKYDLQTWTRRMEPVLPATSFLSPSPRFDAEIAGRLNTVEPGAEMPVRVITVPKTIKTPRIIAIEPTAMQYAQQAIQRALRDALGEDDFLSRVIGTDDQEPNRFLACEGSRSGNLATLDLSEASDRVSNQHVLAMMSGYPHLSAAVQATRSRKADVPGYGVIRLAKFASMGSALTFDLEAMVFLTMIFLAIQSESSTSLCREELIERFSDKVRVFGDDLIVPRDYVLTVIDVLSTFGYKVNIGKSYWTGRFRESCGREYYDGQDVSIVKVREMFPTSRQNAAGVIALVKFRNQCYWSGLWQSAKWLDVRIRKLLKEFPNVAPTAPVLGRESALGYEFRTLDPKNHSPIVKGYRVVAKAPPSPLEGPGALLKCLLGDSQWQRFGLPKPEPLASLVVDAKSVDDEHLERTGRPERVSIKLGWQPPY